MDEDEARNGCFAVITLIMMLWLMWICYTEVIRLRDFYVQKENTNIQTLKQISASLERIASNSVRIVQPTGVTLGEVLYSEYTPANNIIGSIQMIPDLGKLKGL